MKTVYETVREIISEVRRKGDTALCSYARRFDEMTLKPAELLVSKTELKAAKLKVSSSYLKALKECAKQIEAFARSEKKHVLKSWIEKQGSRRLGQWVQPVDSAGLYIPGGRFPYPSTVLMTAIPARIAGVSRIVMASPAKNMTPEVLAAADLVGVDAVYRIGGAGAIAALAYGTRMVQSVDFIVGPGNQYVMEAKRQVFGDVGIDSLAGPSEVLIIADASVPLSYIQNDLLAQAEHDPESHSIFISTDARLIAQVKSGLDPRIASRVRFQKASSLKAAFDAANKIGAEHFEILLKDAHTYLPWVRHAGAIFLGPATTAVLGDYVAGPSHVLPTQRSARFSSGLSVATFLKRSSVIGFEGRTPEQPLWEAAMTMAATEGMEFHGQSLRVRLQRHPS